MKRTFAGLLVLLAGCSTPSDPPASVVGPTLGWDSWNLYGCHPTAAGVRAQADALITTGLAGAGYRTVVVDDCWSLPSRGPDGRLRADPAKFPGGMSVLARYLHERGLRFGLYASPGTRTCAQLSGVARGSTGSAGHERLDAQTFADWGVDYLKYDWCGAGVPHPQQQAAFRLMHDELARTGRAITYAINPNSGVAGPPPGAHGDWSGIADAVRVTNDVIPAWRTGAGPSNDQGIADVLDAVPPEPGPVRDLDMLVAGLPGISDEQARTQITQWARLGSPLILGTDVARLSPDLIALLSQVANR